MNEATIRRLNAINRRFYEARADEFNRSRERAWRGWTKLFDRLGARLPRAPRVLDLGCGNGRFARFLAGTIGEAFTYDGVDASELGLAHAAARLAPFPNVRLHRHDFIVEPIPLPEALRSRRFDVVVLFGVLHHVPGHDHRIALSRAVSRYLAAGGILAYTVWRFDRFARFTRKLVPWDGFSVDERELEPGDHLMTWGRTDVGYRYCHAMSDDEAEELARALPLVRVDDFLGDDDMNRYYVFMRSMEEPPLDGG